MKTFSQYLFEEVSQSDLVQIDRYADKIFAPLNINVKFSKHFLDKIKDERNKKPINQAELVRLFRLAKKKYGKKIANMNPDVQAVISDTETDVNIPFALKPKGDVLLFVAKTVMRKKNFRTNNPVFKV